MSAPTGAKATAPSTGERNTTTVSTIAVQSGSTKLVLALLQCAERVELKIQEMVPLFTDIGSNLEEASQLCKQHDSVLEKLHGKQNPVEELLKQADETISRQKPKKEVYKAMAENLGLAWRDLNTQLEQRKLILHQAVVFHTRARELLEKLTRAEMEFGESFIPHDAQKCQLVLEQLRTTRQALSSCSKQLSAEAGLLLDFVRPIAERSLGDSRPEYMRQAAERTLREITDYEDFLQSKMAEVEVILSQREFMLSGSIRKRELEESLRLLEGWYRSVGKPILDKRSLGSSNQITQAILADHLPKLEDVRGRRQAALKLLKSTEESSCGGYIGSDLQQRAYLLLSNIVDLEDSLQTRIEHLRKASQFFSDTDEMHRRNGAKSNAEREKTVESVIREGQDLVKFYEVEPSAVAGIKIALNKLQAMAAKKEATDGVQKSVSSNVEPAETRKSMKAGIREPKRPAREPVSSLSDTENSPSTAKEQVPTPFQTGEKSLSTSSTDSDLYEEITPRVLEEDKVQLDVQRKIEECKQNLVKGSTRETTSANTQAIRGQKDIISAPLASLEESFDEEVVSTESTSRKQLQMKKGKVTSTANVRQEYKSEVKITKQLTQVSTIVAGASETSSRSVEQEETTEQTFSLQRSSSFMNFSSKIESIVKWLHEVLDAFLRESIAVGADLSSAKKFYQEHSKMQNDLKIKEMDAMAAFSTLPAVLSIGGKDAADAQKYGQQLRDDWERIGNILEMRTRLAQRYVNFLKLSDQLSSDMSEVEETVGRPRADLSEAEQRELLQSWMNAQQAIVQFNHQAKIIQDDAKAMKDPYLNVSALISAVQAVQATLSTRRDVLKKTFDVWEDRKEPPPPPKASQAEQLMRETQRTKESALKLEKELFPTIPRELNRAESIRRYLDRHMDTLMPLVKTVQSELEVRLRSIDHLLSKSQEGFEKKELVKVKDVLDEALSRLQAKINDYESIVEKLAIFLVNVEEMEKSAETVEKLGKDSGCSFDIREGPQSLEQLARTLESQQAHARDRFVALAHESDDLVQLIDRLEPPGAAARDKEKISRLVETTKQHFDSVLSQSRVSLAESKKLSDFNSNIQMLNQQIDRLSEDLSSLRSTFGDNLTAAKAARVSFEHFEDTVDCLERQINEFVSLSQRLVSDRRLDTRQAKSEVASLQYKWGAFTRLVQDNRKLVDVAVLYFTVLDE
ncbi:hypothetical protein BIW11_01523, partial [Tropilaelaps mercedesae]